jgi:hypothetical protein
LEKKSWKLRLRTAIGGGILFLRQWTFRFDKQRGFSWLAERTTGISRSLFNGGGGGKWVIMDSVPLPPSPELHKRQSTIVIRLSALISYSKALLESAGFESRWRYLLFWWTFLMLVLCLCKRRPV